MASDLNGTVAIVTGASSGIGEATARSLAAAGATVALVARRKDRLDALAARITQAGGTAFVLPADITDQAAAEAAVAATIREFGRLDILVNNAGIMVVGPFVDADSNAIDRMIDINSRAMLYISKAALPHLKAAAAQGRRGVADIVNVSSLAGRVANGGFASYSLTKFGLNGFSEALRQELAPDHVRVTVVEPGPVNTELNDHHADPDVERSIGEVFASIEALEAEDIADGITYAVTRRRRVAIREIFITPTNQA